MTDVPPPAGGGDPTPAVPDATGGHEPSPLPPTSGWPGQWPPTTGAGWPGQWPPPPAGYRSGPLLRPAFAPGPVFIGLTLAVLGAGVVCSSGSDTDFLGVLSILIGLNIGLVWIVAFAVGAQDTRLLISRRAWVRWALPPAIFFICTALIVSGLPGKARFEMSRSALEQAAARAQAGNQYGSGWIGLEYLQDVRVAGPTTIFALTSDESGGCSLAFAPQDNTDLQTWLGNSWNVSDYGNGWWYGCDGGPSD